ncbi:MAG TPA: M4 family metallopeptidase [Candidatus Deferrimicrobium sp.]|nr:M4 family metallopeptidase [Candidatus Deferrimicrobium sp.]
MKTHIGTLVFLLVTFDVTYSQIDTTFLASYDSTHSYFLFKANINITVPELVSDHKSTLMLNSDDSLIINTVEDDELGIRHYRYKQYYKNVKVDGLQFYIHANQEDIPFSANGDLRYNLNVGTTASISDFQAINNALSYVNATTYFWQDSSMENALKEETNNPDTSYYPIAQLVITTVGLGLDNNPQNFGLCYKVPIMALVPRESYDVYIDAITGGLVKTISAFDASLDPQATPVPLGCAESCIPASANLLLNYGWQTIHTDRITHTGVLCDYRLKDTCTGTYLFVVKRAGTSGQYNYYDGTNNWTDDGDKPGTTTLWCIEVAHDYYRFTFGRNSYNGDYSQIKAFNHVDKTSWIRSGEFMEIRDDETAIDVIGHELAHGVTQDEAGLNYDGSGGEPGALNESFSDIFGTMIEFYAKSNYNANGPGDYLIGEDVSDATCDILRSMVDPKSLCQPNTYGGTWWVNPQCGTPDESNDWCGIHRNDGVQNFWFYLLSEGGSGHIDDNSNNPAYCVDKIGRDTAAAICYRSLTEYLTSTSDYHDARFYSILSAKELYGANSNAVAQVTQAWHAVGVGQAFEGIIEYNNLSVPGTKTISHNSEIVFNNLQVTAPNGNLTVTSNTRIVVKPTSMASSGSYFHAYITPACPGGARVPKTEGGVTK